ncbi:MAG: hypothetical protein HUU25_11880 [Candidatus Sumerlaeia bacterium]|nr:hypothetical protein [Candidatus Sumerlaeia bacterium]
MNWRPPLIAVSAISLGALAMPAPAAVCYATATNNPFQFPDPPGDNITCHQTSSCAPVVVHYPNNWTFSETQVDKGGFRAHQSSTCQANITGGCHDNPTIGCNSDVTHVNYQCTLAQNCPG